MFTENLLIPFFEFIEMILKFLPDAGSFPQTLQDSFNHVIDIIFSNLNFLGMFIRLDTIKILVPLIVFVVNFELIYRLTMWILSKIPFLNIR